MNEVSNYGQSGTQGNSLVPNVYEDFVEKGSQVGLFCCHTNIQKKLFALQLKNYEKELKNLWLQVQHKKAAQLYFHCGPLGKMIYQKIKNIYIKREHRKH